MAATVATMRSDIQKMQGQRLKRARIEARFRSARAAALEFNWPESSYRAHESGTRTIGLDDAERYAKRFRSYGANVTARGILFGTDAALAIEPPRTIQIVGHVGAGGEAFFDCGQGPFGEIDAPDGATDATVAVEIRGTSLGELFDRWIIFYDDRREPVTPDLLGKLCVIGLADERIVVKKLKRGHRRDRFDLMSNVGEPMYDQVVIWAARVKQMVPK